MAQFLKNNPQFPEPIKDVIKLILKDPLNELEILEETDDYVVYIDSSYIESDDS